MQLNSQQYNAIQLAALNREFVTGATHRFYRYPARFSPQLVRASIETFTDKGDLVLDPFIGGGTTAVEALRTSRKCIGADINELAIFVSEVKSTVLSEAETSQLRRWLPTFESGLKICRDDQTNREWQQKGYLRHLNDPTTWRHRNIISAALREIERLCYPRLENFARCVILRSAQLSLDGRQLVMTISDLRNNILKYFDSMLIDMDQLRSELKGIEAVYDPHIFKCDSSTLHENKRLLRQDPPKLILTSPPYPGVHVLYHRWQVNGRRETSAPYWIANKLDGDSERYYTLGNRHEKGLKTYFNNLESIYSSIAQISGPSTAIIQVVAFSEPEWQLPKYLEVMDSVGLEEMGSQVAIDTKIWRDVPNRKWHAEQQERKAGSREVVLFHTKR